MTPLRRTFKAFFPGLLFILCCLTFPVFNAGGQTPASAMLKEPLQAKPRTAVDSLPAKPGQKDSLAKSDTLSKKKKQTITEIVDYEARDSLVFLAGGVGKLYGQAKVNYDKMSMEAGYIQLNSDSSLMYAIGRTDSAGAIVENPVLKDKSGEYTCKQIRYNFKTGKGLISQVITQQGEGYIVSGLTKKTAEEELCMIDGKYTTCDNHDHPHFYLDLSKAKVVPGKYMVSGPAHLVMEDVHLPLFIPFGYFPISHKYSSGILSPSYGDELSQGFYLKDLGYYFAINDYVDVALTSEIYSKGSWGLTGRTNYRVKYKYSGSFNASYLETVTSEKNLPDYAKAKNFNLTWSHSQDAKANPYRTFSASVNFATSGYARSDLKSYYNPEAFSSNTKSSSINMSQRFGDSPFSANMSMNITQRSKDSTLSVSLPSLTISMSSINPFKRKNAVGNPRWYEDIRLGYTGSFANSISEVKEDQFLHKSLIKDWKNGAQHNLSLSSKFNLLNYVTVTPSVNYTERWYSSSIRKNFDQATNKEVTDTIWGFNRVWDYSASLTADTKLYGMYTPVRKIFGNKIGQIRHVITPSISYNYKPDFGAQRYGYYDDYSYTDTKGVLQTVTYSRYANSLYGSPSAGKSGSIGFNVINNLEMKLNQPTDTGVVEKKVSLIDLFQFGSSYNLAADSLNWSDISVALRLKFGKKYTLNLSTSLDPYMYQLNSSGNPVKVNETTFAKLGIPGRLTSTGTSFSYSISNETFKKKEKKTNGDTGSGSSSEGGEAASDGSAPTGTGQAPPAEQKPLDPEEMLYQPFKMPWSINFSYSLRYGRYTFNKEKLDYNYKLTQNLSLSGNISLYDKWKFTASTSYNFEYKQFATMNCTVSRDLHCWEMSASFIPIGPYKSYNFSIRVKSSLLQDLKYEQHQNPRDNYIWGN